MLDWLKDLVSPVRIVDSRFGNLRYLRDARFWEGNVTFTPTGTRVEVLIPGDPTGPTRQQNAFFDRLQQRYDTLWPDVHARLDAEAQRAAIEARNFVLVCIDLPEPDAAESGAEWSLSYETSPPSWHFTVQMAGWMPSEILAEC